MRCQLLSRQRSAAIINLAQYKLDQAFKQIVELG